ncbi:MAG: hypothetical protein PVF32_16295, partial [Desulfobacterales bacterium]
RSLRSLSRNTLFSFLTYLHAMPHVKVESTDEVLMSMPSGIDVLMSVGPDRWREAKLGIENLSPRVVSGSIFWKLPRPNCPTSTFNGTRFRQRKCRQG